MASGKALLAAARLDVAALRQRLGTLVSHTPNSITDIDTLHAELERTRARGYAENREEWRRGVCGLGAPVFNARGDAVAALGMSVPSIRFARTQARGLAEQVMACTRDASGTLGYRVGPAPATRLPTPTTKSRRLE
ncbi:Transcriptional regulator, IclR family [Polaromonas sp. CG9_12]|nr:Transcriptional regulator, IclR family [Polaromonas sp. CG9_12]